MGNKDSVFVPPPTSFKRNLILNPNGAKDADVFSSVADINTFIDSLDVGEQPSSTRFFNIEWHPSTLVEDVWLKDFVSLTGVGGIGQHLILGDSFSNGIMLSLGLNSTLTRGSILRIAPPAKNLAVLLRNSNSIFTIREDSFGTINAGDVLKITPSPGSQVTITFVGGESTASAVASVITAQGGPDVEAVARGGFVEIRHVTIGDVVTVNGTGAPNTANVALGFSNDTDTVINTIGLESRAIDNCVIFGGVPFTDSGILSSDRNSISAIKDVECLPGAGSTALKLIDQSAMIANNFLNFGSGTGLDVGPSCNLTVIVGSIFANSVLDLNIDPAGILNAHGLSYTSRNLNGGMITPKGDIKRIAFNFIGNIAIGNFDGIKGIPYDSVIQNITVSREVQGIAGTTEIDILKGASGGAASTIFTTTANRPKINAIDGNNLVIESLDPDILNLNKGDFLIATVLTKETGTPQNLNITIDMVVK